MGCSRRACLCAVDVAVAVVVALLSLAAAALAETSVRDMNWIGRALLIVGSAALVARRQAPVVVLVITAACVLTYQALGYPGLLTTLPVLVSVYTAVLAGKWKVTFGVMIVGLLAVGCVVNTVPSLDRSMRILAEAKFLMVGWMVAGGAMAQVSRQRQEYIREVEQRAYDAERTREELARRRASEERLRIARDLHDSLTHSISIVKVQAGVAVHLARKHGEEVPPALLAIEEASAEAIRELRATLTVLRRPPAENDDVGDARNGSGLDRLPHLVERARSAGLPAQVTVTGQERPLPVGVSEAAYRVVQESLTNVSRHAGSATATVRLHYGSDEFVVEVDDDGRGCARGTLIPGVGLIGMRERVAGFGGRLTAGPQPSGGFAVHATFPLAGTAMTAGAVS
ncbi:sensor histidine kinase [Desertimonas flava]|uniref:sensor histidine kinase n=1 Tax=Desertimonas flava TaxID=2064846 RepID=UPI000E34EF05|nr:sensor histidine kinase [Desertimonas flava]